MTGLDALKARVAGAKLGPFRREVDEAAAAKLQLHEYYQHAEAHQLAAAGVAGAN